MSSVRPIIRWAGSKRKLLPKLLPFVPEKFGRYFEPFAGSMCLFLQLQPPKAVIGDLNEELILFYEELRRHPYAIARRVEAMPREEVFYYRLRSIPPTSMKGCDRAARFLYLNRFCFNGVYRTNRQGMFNVARGRHMGEVPQQAELVNFACRIKNVDFRAADFASCIADAKKGDFIYADPPYTSEGKRDRGEYGPGSFRQDDWDRFEEAVRRADERGARLLISFADKANIRRRFKGWTIHKIAVPRSVAGFSERRDVVSEVIITNN